MTPKDKDERNYIDAGRGLEIEQDTPRVSEDYYQLADEWICPFCGIRVDDSGKCRNQDCL